MPAGAPGRGTTAKVTPPACHAGCPPGEPGVAQGMPRVSQAARCAVSAVPGTGPASHAAPTGSAAATLPRPPT